jgi:hypothetical protein
VAFVGLFGVLSSVVAARRRELGLHANCVMLNSLSQGKPVDPQADQREIWNSPPRRGVI